MTRAEDRAKENGRRIYVPSVKEMAFDELEDVLSAFLAMILIPLTFSITQGIL